MENSSQLIARTEQILAHLISFQSLPGTSGKEIIDWVSTYLQQHGVQPARFPFPAADSPQTRAHGKARQLSDAPANLFATIGPQRDGGICLSGHLDVVPAAAENWTKPPFQLSIDPGVPGNGTESRRFFGRGSSDMKGFAALVLAMVPEWVQQQHNRPIHLAFTYDEESGCRGAPFLIRQFGRRIPRPGAVIVGEPTGMEPVIGHKGGASCVTVIHGVPAHSSNPAEGASAIYMANDIINFLRSKSDEMHREGPQDLRFSPSHSTLSVGTIRGGTARNIIPEECQIVWEIRSLPGENSNALLQQLDTFIHQEVLALYKPHFPEISIRTVLTAEYPPLVPDPASPALDRVRQAGCDAASKCVTFGTEAGHYQASGIPAVVWGPGNIAQAHIIDEYIDAQDLVVFLDYMKRL